MPGRREDFDIPLDAIDLFSAYGHVGAYGELRSLQAPD